MLTYRRMLIKRTLIVIDSSYILEKMERLWDVFINLFCFV